MRFESRNPFNQKLLKMYAELSNRELQVKMKDALYAAGINRRSSLKLRLKRLLKLKEVLTAQQEHLARLISLEMGKPIVQSLSEVAKCEALCDFYIENAQRVLKDEKLKIDQIQATIVKEPVGLVLAIMPWNFPLWQVMRCAIPALTAGNGVLIKHAPNVPQTAEAIEHLFAEANFPDHLVQNLFLSEPKVKPLMAHQAIGRVCFTGSVKTGAKIGSYAGKQIKKSILELGGCDAFIVCKDANLKEAARVAVKSRMLNNGQSCIAAKRWIVDNMVYDQFAELTKVEMEALNCGDQLLESTHIGPLARKSQLEFTWLQMQKALDEGAQLYFGGQSTGQGFLLKPTLLTEVTEDMVTANEEVFGPVASLMRARDEEHAISIANHSRFGLGASIWTTDVEKAKKLAKQVEAGSVHINNMVHSSPHLPFGGIKNSGYGRELGKEGLLEMVNTKTIVTS